MDRDLRDMMQRTADGVDHVPRPSRGLVRRAHLRRARTTLLVGATAVALSIGGFAGASSLLRDEAVPPVNPNESPFVGTWASTDIDGSTQTMVVRATGEGAYEIEVRDDSAGVCSEVPSTMTGTGRLDGPTKLVIPSPVLTCDDGSEPQVGDGPSVEELLRNFTFVHIPETDKLTDNLEVVWDRGETTETSGGMWPQSSLEEIREAQRLADEGDPRYTWQVVPKLAVDPNLDSPNPYEAEIFARFLQEELGWQEFAGETFLGWTGVEGSYDASFVRCAPGRTNPLYPDDPQGRGCAPTIDELHYETVQINVAQLDRQGPSGIWVVTRWKMLPPSDEPITGPASDLFDRQIEQVVPPTDAEVTGLLEAFLQARIDGEGAQEYLHSEYTTVDEIPLLYATSSGAPFERYEIGRVEGPVWPIGHLIVKVRLFAEGGNTVVEQPFFVYREGDDRLGLDYVGEGTTENGEVVAEPSSILDGQVTYSAPGPDWHDSSGVPEVGYLERHGLHNGADAHIEIHPNSLPPDDCDTSGGTPPSAEALVQAIRSDPDLETTAPVPARVGGIDALRLDVAAAPGAATCGGGSVQVAPSPYVEGPWGGFGPGHLVRLYVLDLPEPLRVPSGPGPARTLTILIVVGGPNDSEGPTEGFFERMVASAAPLLDSFEFHAE